MHERVHVFGIRHHGPGSAASLLAALHELDPAAVLVELPGDVEAALPLAAAPGMRPPVALLVHDKKDPQKAQFQPFAEYSPEWQAMRWAFARQRPVLAIDLAAGIELRQEGESQETPDEQTDDREPRESTEPSALERDPLTALAVLAGHSDGESWWNAIVEQNRQGAPVFRAITEAMAELRRRREAQLDEPDTAPRRRLELRREAQMRERIRDALQQFEGDLAVVVGAWHAPALHESHTRKDDRALLKGLRPTPVEVTWVPWTDTRLASASGYGAGVVSPGWYRHLWRCFTEPGGDGVTSSAVRWQTETTRLLRDEGLAAATASTIEAARLATCLAALRGHPVPGLAEMRDASLAALCHGDSAPMQVVTRRLIVGERIGEVDEGVPQMALAADLQRQQKRLRLKPEAVERDVAVDLRTEAGLAKSTLLHRLLLIDVPWGRLIDASAGRGTFREVWQLCWQPEWSVHLAEALRWGTTIEAAAHHAAIEKARDATGIVAVARTVEACLLADLGPAAEATISVLQQRAAGSSDVLGLMAAATPMTSVLRYGTARRLPTEALTALLDSIVTEVVAGLRYACRSLDADAAREMQQQLAAFERALDALGDDDHLHAFGEATFALADDPQTVPQLAGWSARSLYERSLVRAEQTADAMSRALSPGVAPDTAGAWLEGFLGDAAQVLMHDDRLLGAVDTWLATPDDANFVELLPVLRRAFSAFEGTERRRLMQQLVRRPGRGSAADTSTAAPADDELPAPYLASLPMLETMLGLRR